MAYNLFICAVEDYQPMQKQLFSCFFAFVTQPHTRLFYIYTPFAMMPENPYKNFNAQQYVDDATSSAKQRSMGVGGTAGSAVGTAIGAAIGSVIPGLGTAIGAAAGSALGSGIGYLVGGNKAREQAQMEADNMLSYGQFEVTKQMDDMFEGQFETAQQNRLLSMRRNVAPMSTNYLKFM